MRCTDTSKTDQHNRKNKINHLCLIRLKIIIAYAHITKPTRIECMHCNQLFRIMVLFSFQNIHRCYPTFAIELLLLPDETSTLFCNWKKKILQVSSLIPCSMKINKFGKIFCCEQALFYYKTQFYIPFCQQLLIRISPLLTV